MSEFVAAAAERLRRPLPRRCPHCDRTIGGVRHRLRSTFLPLWAVATLFAVLVAYLIWLTR